MGDIHVVSNSQNLQLEFEFDTPQQFFYNVAVINTVQNQQIFHGKGQWDGQMSFLLGRAKDLVGSQLIIYWTIIDPAGADNDYSAKATVKQNGAICAEPQTCAGKSCNNAAYFASIGTFVG